MADNSLNELVQEVGKHLIENNISISCAESCTGGLFASYLTSVSGISSVFELGMVTYSNRIKQEKLGVKKSTLDKFGAVSSETAAEMAQGIQKLANSDIGISVTGVAGPNQSEGKLPGTVFIAVSYKTNTIEKRLDIQPKNRDFVREQSVFSMFKTILDVLQG